MKIEEFDYNLPKSFVAQYPLKERDESRLMIIRRGKNLIEHSKFKELHKYLNPGDLIVVNNSRVIPARLIGKAETGAVVELLVIPKRDLDGKECEVLIKNSKRLKAGIIIDFGENIQAELKELNHGRGRIRFLTSYELMDILKRVGRVPLPPYIKRKDEPLDREHYQTIFANRNGSIAAPTAGFHFSHGLLEELKTHGIKIVTITLHVGTGTFTPIKSENIEDHKMEGEWVEISEEVANEINDAKLRKSKLIAVGTTTTRALESFADNRGLIKPGRDFTSLFIYPPYNFRVIDGLITNFHLPKSTPLLLVSAFAGKDLIFNAYNEAIKKGYRFYSYGDAMLIL